MNTTMSRTLSNLDSSARRAAERAARRAGMALEDWLNEAIFERAAASEGEAEAADPLATAVERMERRFARNEERTARAFEAIAMLLERATAEARRHEPHAADAQLDEDREAAEEHSNAWSELPQFAAGGGRPPLAGGDVPQSGDPGGNVSEHDLRELRREIAVVARSLADLAPRNAVVALDGAIRDLSQRVALLRESGQGEALLGPLERMAAELRAALMEHDPREATAALEREISAIAAKIDGLARRLVDPEAFERIRVQTEEVRDLLAAAAMRTTPIEAIERQIGELADRIEKLGASPAPDVESAEMAASLADLRREIERNDPGGVLASIEQRLEHIASRLDEETARARKIVVDPRPLDDLAERIEGIRQTLEAKSQAGELAQSGAATVQPLLAELIEKLDRLPQPETNERPLAPGRIEAALEALGAKLDSWGTRSEKSIGKLADEIARRIEERPADVGPAAIAEEIARINERLDALSASRANEMESLAREICGKLREAGLIGAAPPPQAMRPDLVLGLAELRAEQASAERRTQARLASVQNLLEQLAARLANPETGSPPASEAKRDEILGYKRPEPILRSVELLGAEDGRQAIKARPGAERADEEDDPLLTAANGEDFLLEPGAGARQFAQEPSESAHAAGSRTNPAVSAHIAAARRAARAALAESSDTASGAAASNGLPASNADRVKTFYAHHRRSVLLAIALAVVAASAARLAVLHPPFSLKFETRDAAFKATSANPPAIDAPQIPSASAPDQKPVDTTPTASISPAGDAPNPRGGEKAAIELIPPIPPDVPQPLRDAVAAGSPAAQYELAQRLFEGRGAPKNQKAAALWFERAAAAGLAPAQFRIGMMYEKGMGVARDRAAARRWYLQAAEAGNARAAHNLAVTYAEAQDGKADYAEAAKWFRKAGALGVEDSQFNLGVLYARGLGEPQDLGQSWLWFSLAAAQGDAEAAKKRDEVASKMDPAALAAAADALAKFKVAKPVPAANEVAAPPGGWDIKPAPSDQSLLPPPRTDDGGRPGRQS